jgi:arsenite methyltransferase
MSDENRELEPTYFDVQAFTGTTKHMGGLRTTKELLELCHVSEDKYVLEVGCGAGATTCYIAKEYGSRVVGVDLHEKMANLARARAKREGVEDRTEFRVADAQELPFEDGLFDVVIAESVNTFIQDKQRALSEYARVAKPGGYVGLNEEIWLKSAPPPAEIVEFVAKTWDIESEIPTADGWVRMLENAGLRDVVARPYTFSAAREATQVLRYGCRDLWGMLSRTISLYLTSSEFRQYMKGRQRLPKGIWDYLGYGLFVGRA